MSVCQGPQTVLQLEPVALQLASPVERRPPVPHVEPEEKFAEAALEVPEPGPEKWICFLDGYFVIFW